MDNTTTASTQTVVLAASEIAALPAVLLDPLTEGVTHRVLWHDDTSMAGVLTVEAGHQLGRHAHRRNHHHLWVLDGEAEILGAVVHAGAYVHVPAGVDHDLDARGTQGCVIYYLYVRPSR